MSTKFILAIDQGTTGTTVSLVGQDGKIKHKVNNEFPQIFPQPGWVEHNLNDIWNSVEVGIAQIFESSGINSGQIHAIGITNQRETVGIWNRSTGEPLANAIVWQCRRTTEFCNGLKGKGLEATISEKTGLVIDPYFSGSKVRWLLREKMLEQPISDFVCGTIDTFLVWKLTGGKAHVTDPSNASRTQLMNIKTGEWDSELLDLFEVPKEILPSIQDSNSEFGKTSGQSKLADGIPIHGILGDQQAALFGQACFEAGMAKCTYGTGSFILMNTGQEMKSSHAGLLTTVGWKLTGETTTYAFEGGAFVCGAAVQWLRDQLGLIDKSEDVERLAKTVDSSEGVEFVPALSGLGAPYWEPEARGVITGLTRGSNKAHIARATLEAMALQNVEILNAMAQDLGSKMKDLKVDGGACKNDLLMQYQADYLGVNILRPEIIESTVLGAAYAAGLGSGFWSDKRELAKVWSQDREFKVTWSDDQRKQRLTHWQAAVKRTY